MNAKQVSNLIDLLQQRVQQQPRQKAYTFLVDGEDQEVSLTYEQLDQRASAIAARLQYLHATGERVLLLYPPGLEYISAFWGCLYAGAIAVPAYPPRQNRSLDRLQSIAADAESTLALTTSALLAKTDAFAAQCPDLKALRWLATDTVADELAQHWRRPAIGSDDLAFLQYTSGSTSTPKGVMVTHGNLLSNEEMIKQAFGQSEHSIIVGWLPLYHDMGLIGNVLQPVYVGAPCVLMSPVSFLQNPYRWLAAISRYRATTSGGPNFAYDLCVRKINAEQRESLDLSSWEVAFNGAEPVRAETMKAFAETFGPYGFRESAFRPCYGLAEATLLVSTGDAPLVKTVDAQALQKNLVFESANGAALASCGRPSSGQAVRIYRPDTLDECLPGEIGEICVSGANVTKGYWNRFAETVRVFQPRVDGETVLRTGDLGVLIDGDLFVTGRIKDLVIIRGRNHYPHDIERTVERSHPALRPGSGAAFSIDVDGEERLVVAHELNGRGHVDRDEIMRAISEAVVDEHELLPHAVMLLKTGSIPKTSSGKIQRHACREKFLTQSFEVVAEWKELPRRDNDETDLASWLRAELAAKRGVNLIDIDVNRPLSDYALDSLEAIELTHHLEEKFSVVLSMASLLQNPTIAEIAAQAQPQIVQTNPSDPRPEFSLSHGQRALWFLYQLAPESAAYNISTALRIVSQLDTAALRRAFQVLLDRHSSLRTVFEVRDDEPVQRILEHAEISFNEIDASGWGEPALNEHLVAEAQRPFDLQHGPVWRVHLFSRAENDHVLLLVIHHIVSDFWSLSVLASELGALYNGEISGTPVQLPTNTIEYSAYVAREQETLNGPEGERLSSYWLRQLAGDLPLLDLPTDRPRPAVQTYNGASLAFDLSEEVTKGLKQLAHTHGATLYTTLLAAFQTLLFRYTGQEDLLVGSPTAGRNQNGLANLVGYFVNPIVLRSNPSAETTFTSFLEQTKQTVLDAFAHQDYPFPLLVERLQPERDTSRSPLFQAMFILQKAHLLNREGLTSFTLGEAGARMNLGALEVESVSLDQRISQFELTLVMAEAGETLKASLQYNTDLFEAATIARLADHLNTLLQGIVTQPQQTLSQLPLLTRTEQQQILVDWNSSAALYPGDLCLHQLFEAQAARTPEATALIFGEERLTYRELNQRAERLAAYLLQQGVGPEVLVGVCMERSVEMVVTLIGILKAGGAYVPLDPAYPSERLAFMLEDGEVRVLITEESLLEKLPATLETSAEFISDTVLPSRLCLCRVGTVPSVLGMSDKIRPANLAYVIYTSGSTGKPKGVAITHHSAVIMAQWAGEYFTPEQLAGVLASTSISFDLSVFELFAPLSTGGTVILAENALHLPLLPAASEVTLVNTVPSAMAELVRSGSIPANVETVNLAGEALPRELVRQLYQVENINKVINLYGPSEDTTYSTFALVPRDDAKAPAIGRPLPGTQAYVLDRAGQPVPVGVAGELYLGGEGLSRGYLNRPELTAERFVPDPFSNSPGGRLYRTGDLVRYCADGVLDYLGRMDHQVKLRGFRIELGEIEEVLRRHETVKEAVVLVSERESEQRLVAFVVGPEEPVALRASVRERLPEYMVPSLFITLAELPLTANGKVDRRALLALDVSQSTSEKEILEPRTETEIEVAEMWRELLHVERASLDDNFFEAGGHSLLATRLISQVTKRFNLEVALRSFFEEPTIAGLANQIDLALKSASMLKAPPIRPRRAIANAPLSFAQQRLWFLSQLEPDNTAYNMPAALRLTGDLDIEALEASLSDIIRRHEILRTIFVTEDGEPVQVVLPARCVKIPQIDLSTQLATEREAEALRLATEEAQKPFELSRGPLIRFTLLRLAAGEHVLLFTVHHIVFDGWSIGVLVRELTALYGEARGTAQDDVPGLPVQYGDFATWQREWLQGEVMDLRLAYWREQLANAPEGLNLPTDKPRPAVLGTTGASQSFQLPADLVASLKTIANEERATLFMVLLATFQVLLSRYSGQTDIMVGTAVANRNRAEIEGLIGFFVNMLVMRGDLSGDPMFKDYLAKIRETALAAYAHQDLPFETLVESLQVARSLNRTPLFQTTFILQNEPAAELELAGLKLTPLPVETGRAQFDLSLSMSETNDGRLNGSINYNTDLFSASTIARMQEHFRTLLESVVQNPRTRLSALPLLTDNERQHILFDWNDNVAAYPENICLYQLVEAQAARTPEATALIFGAERLTYRELHDRAAQLASHLRERGVGPETFVGVCLERSVEMVVALLGILKAGGAYVPLDPAYPAERLAFMLADAGVRVLITEQPLLDRLGITESAGVSVVVDPALPRSVLCLLDTAHAPTSQAVNPANLAYVIYTSGSTGQPKGVSITHQNAVTMVQWAGDYFTREQLAGMLASTSISFDLSVFELFVPLSVGGKVILADNALQLPNLPAAGEVTLVNTVPSAIGELSRNGWIPANVRTINLAGEALSRELVDQLYRQDTVERVINLYGPSEDTTYSTFALIERADHRTPAIGKPLPNTQAYVLDQAGHPVPVGVIGELYLGGMGLSRGYLNRAELTAERFVPDPFSGKSGARLYRTGDTVRFSEQGVLEYLGRIDHQVKVRGYRIELSEVESVLRRHEQVREAVVIVREVDGGKRLVAYLTGSLQSVSPMLRPWLRDRLPDYMVPASFVVLEQMPLSANGKVDRRALLNLGTLEFAGEREIIEPRTETEIAVAKMWREILSVDQVSVDQNFFEIGGHSLLATRLMSQVTKTFGVEVSLRRFFEAPTVEAQAEEIERALKAETKFTTPSIGRASRDRYRMDITPHGPITLPDAMRKEAS